MRTFALAAGLFHTLVGCGGDEYSVVLVLPKGVTPEGGAELAVVREGCTGLSDGRDPPEEDVVRTRAWIAEEGAPRVGSIQPGWYGFYARLRSPGTCEVVFAGCARKHLHEDAEGRISIPLEAVLGPDCPSDLACDPSGACVASDGGPPLDAGGCDRDGDGFDRPSCTGPDCDDGDPSVHPGAPDGEQQWSFETVDSAGHVGEYASLAVDASGLLYAAYEDEENGDPRYATDASGVWALETIDPGPEDRGPFTDLALDGAGAAHVSYFDEGLGDLVVATNESGVWAADLVDFGGRTGRYTSIAVDIGDFAHVAYQDEETGILRHAWETGGGWSTETIDSTPERGAHASLAIAPDGVLHVCYEDVSNGDLLHASNAAGWTSEIVASDGVVGEYASLAIDSSGVLHVAFYDRSNGDLDYATNESGTWSVAPIDTAGDTGSFASLAIGADGLHVAYADNDLRDLRHATNAGGEWVSETVESIGSTGSYAALGLGPGAIHVLYFEETTFDLRHAVRRANVDGIDEDCDGADGRDADGDGHGSTETGGDDCDDADPARFEGC
jgi:hypothetical protein